MRLPRCRILVVLASSAVLICSPAGMRAARAAGGADEHVGNVDFPTSCAHEAQPTLGKGLALLHSFQYQEAAQTFDQAVKKDAACGMAYWGKAMSLYHQLWDFPDAKQLAEGRKDVEQAQKSASLTPREREYIAAAAAFYQDDPKLSHADRRKAYSAAMEKLYSENPGDVEAGALYALSLVALSGDGGDELAIRRQAIATLNPLFAAHPNNPGLAHYLIHAADAPELAEQGLPAARAYAKIAPDSSHAIHMPSHIFMQLGLWPETVDSNLAAIDAAAEATKAGRADAAYQFHAMDFLNYAYLQCGQETKARRLVDDLKSVPGAKPEEIAEDQALFEARNAMELHRWKEAASLSDRDEPFMWRDVTFWARSIGAARTGNLAAARRDDKKLAQAIKAQRKMERKMGDMVMPGESTEQQQADAWIALAQGKSEQALAGLRAAMNREESQRSGGVAMPAREMLADMLLELKRPQEALAEYQNVLKHYPNRFDAVYGAAKAAEAAANPKQAQEFYAQLVKISMPGADRPELQAARTLSARH